MLKHVHVVVMFKKKETRVMGVYTSRYRALFKASAIETSKLDKNGLPINTTAVLKFKLEGIEDALNKLKLNIEHATCTTRWDLDDKINAAFLNLTGL